MKIQRKHFIQQVHIASIILVMVTTVLLLFAGAVTGERTVTASTSHKVKAAKLTKKNKEARKAYQKLLAQKKFKRSKYKKFKYAIIDLDGNGIDELLIDSGGTNSGVMYHQLYAFKQGKVKKLLEVDRVPFNIYDDGTLEYSMGYMGDMENSFYQVKNGTLYESMRLHGSVSKIKNAEYADDVYWTIRKIGNKKVSYGDCKNWMNQFEAEHKIIKVKYYKNTAKSRKSLCKSKKIQ